MALVEENLFGRVDKVAIAVARLKQFESAALAKDPEGYYLAFSGGKDSQCIYHLAKMAGVKFRAYMHLTSVDPPEVLRFVRDNYPDVVRERPKTTMWRLIPHKMMPPTRMVRYCCEELKEQGGAGRLVVTGVRWAESARRSNRRMVETCLKDRQRSFLHPVIDWTDSDVWEFLNNNNISHCCLYDEGFTRVGCVGCPMAGVKNMAREFKRWPQFRAMYIRAFERVVAVRAAKGLVTNPLWSTGEKMFDWWISEKRHCDTAPGLFDDGDDDEG